MAVGTDLFQSFKFVNDLQRKFYEDEEETTLMIGTYGAQTEVNGSLLQKALVVAAETSNEAIPIKAKYEKNVIAHARFLGITDINATPARMVVAMYLPKTHVDGNLVMNKFVFDKDCPLMIDGYEFHIDYDIIITRTRIRTNEYVYTAMYDMDKKNPLSDADTPNLPPVGTFSTESGLMLSFSCVIRQVEQSTVHTKIMTDNSIENKTMSFEYQNQMAYFDLDVTEGSETYHLNPVYDGTINNSKEKYCEYQDIDSNTIRIKFNRDSYIPRINADVAINIKTTRGEGGVFNYVDDIITDLKSEKYGYSGIHCLIKPTTNSEYGINRKTVKELKSIIPREALSRGSIISTTDLEAFFNSTNLDNSKLYFYKKKYNQLDHLYHSYLLMKYGDIIVPTNTVDIVVSSKDIEANGRNWHIKPLTTFVYDGTVARISNNTVENADNPFVYINPFMIGINKSPLVLSYYLTTFTSIKYLEFSYINQASMIQYVASSFILSRSGFSDTDKYKINIDIRQNIDEDFGLIQKNEDGEVIGCKVKVYLLLYTDTDNTVWRYCEGVFKHFDKDNYMFSFEITLITDDTISTNNLMKITNLCQPGSGLVVDSYVNNGMKADILIMAETETYYGNGGFGEIIPNIVGYSLCNRYGIKEGLNLFYNYTQMMSSVPIVSPVDTEIKDEDPEYIFTINKVPMIRKSYITDEYRMNAIINEIQSRRKYIEYCLNILEDGFDIDFKFFNTYGPSRRFVLEDASFINRVNMSVRFRTKLYSNAEKYIIDLIRTDIKSKIEDIGNISDLHMTNIADSVRDSYKDQLEFFEFIGFNGYGPGSSHVYQVTDKVRTDVPEFLNINTLANDIPDIDIVIN